jgi:hypothetical protein
LLDNLWLATVTSAAFLTGAAGAIRFARATVVARRSMWPVLASAAVAAAASAVHAWLVDDRTEDPTAPWFRTTPPMSRWAMTNRAAVPRSEDFSRLRVELR